jgi:hypothetical protein
MQCPSVCFTNYHFKQMLPAVDRLGMPLVTSGQFAYVYKLNSLSEGRDYAVRCFRGYLGDRNERYGAIQEHLHNHPAPFISAFYYEPEGILVGGNRYPVLSMNWIDGPTLDLYVERMLHRPEVLLHLANEWLRLVKSLRDAGIAHGDLQHGNIIVQHGNLCLIDHDGIFVPAMAGWTSSEVGHQHYQHPLRDPGHFDATLDNFSALVIYLTLISLAEKPELWKHHDENLIFTKADFVDPAASALLTQIRGIGPEHERLATVLEEASRKDPAETPCVLDLVTVKTALPTWMTAPADLDAKTKTREVVHAHALPRGPRWAPWEAKRPAGSNMPSTPGSSAVQSVFSQGATAVSARDPNAIISNTIHFGREGLGKHFILWYWGLFLFLNMLGWGFIATAFIGIMIVVMVGLGYGYSRASQLAQSARRAGSLGQPATTARPLPLPPLPDPAMWQKPVSITVPESLVGNSVLSIFHRKDCDWVKQISPRNRVGFRSVSEALSAGFKPCQVCSHVN